MYGYNIAFIIERSSDLNKTFYGLSYGGGIDISFNNSKTRKSYWSFGILIPIVTEEAKEYENYINARTGGRDPYNISSYTISVGYNRILQKK